MRFGTSEGMLLAAVSDESDAPSNVYVTDLSKDPNVKPGMKIT